LQDQVQLICSHLDEWELPVFLEKLLDLLQERRSASQRTPAPSLEGLIEPVLWAATTAGEAKVVGAFLKSDRIAFNWQDAEHARTPFYRACSHGRAQIVEMMLAEPRVDPCRPVKLGATPFFIACQEGYHKVVEQLLKDPRVNPNEVDSSGVPPFFIACQNERHEVLRLLCGTEGINVSRARADGCSSLFYAISHRHLQVAKWILSSGPDVNLDCKWLPANRTALEQAKELKYKEEEVLLEQYSADPLKTSLALQEEFKTPSTPLTYLPADLPLSHRPCCVCRNQGGGHLCPGCPLD